MIIDSLKPLAVDINVPVLDPKNAMGHPEANLAAIRASLRVYGQRKPIVINTRTGYVEAGNGTLLAARAEGWTEIAAVFVDDDPSTAAGFAVADNRTAQLAEWDAEMLAEIMDTIDIPEDDDLQAMLDALEQEMADAEEPAKKDAAEEDLRQEYSVLVHCEGERDQKIILEELARHGLQTRALIVDFPKLEKREPPPAKPLPKGDIEIVRSAAVERTARVMQLEGLFDLPPTQRSEERWRFRLQLDQPWSIGLIVGPSGSGKTTLARALFGANIVTTWPWRQDRAIVDDFPEGLGIAEITALLSSVGFSSPPSWLKPFHVLSNGEQFRVTLARTLAEQPDLAVIDEFTSVVDRTVAQIGSAALAKTIRGSGRRFIAVACHYDIEEWLQPDWKIEMPSAELTWRLLRRRPALQLRVRRTDRHAWELFRRHHYLDHGLHAGAQCFIGEIDGRPAAFTAVLHYPHRVGGGFWREHRTVCLPDFQGVGIGNAMSEFVAGVFLAKGKRYRSTTSHPAMIRHRLRSPLWRCDRAPSMATSGNSAHTTNAKRAAYRYTAGFEYIGPPRPEDAAKLGVR